MRALLICALAATVSCSDKAESPSDSGEMSIPCAGNSIYIEVCIECGDAGGCDEMGYECRSICDADEDCPEHETCMSSDEGNYCDERYACD